MTQQQRLGFLMTVITVAVVVLAWLVLKPYTGT